MPTFTKERTEPEPTQSIHSTVEKCQRCGGYHQALQFRTFAAGPMQTPGGTVAEWWALCPTNGEPILAWRDGGGE